MSKHILRTWLEFLFPVCNRYNAILWRVIIYRSVCDQLIRECSGDKEPDLFYGAGICNLIQVRIQGGVVKLREWPELYAVKQRLIEERFPVQLKMYWWPIQDRMSRMDAVYLMITDAELKYRHLERYNLIIKLYKLLK